MTKKLARIDVQSTLRNDVTRASCSTPAMSKRNTSPNWMPKVRAGGILAGHDYLTGHRPDIEVKAAVDYMADQVR